MNNDNLLAALARLSKNATYVITSLTWYYKNQRGLVDLPLPTYELKTEKQWQDEIADLTPDEIIELNTLLELFKQTTPTLSSATTYVVTSAVAALEKESKAVKITTPTEKQKTGEQWAEQLSRLKPEQIAKISSVIKEVKAPEASLIKNIITDETTGESVVLKRITEILFPGLSGGGDPMGILKLQMKQQLEYNKAIEEHFKQREKELVTPEEPKKPTKPEPVPAPPQKQPKVKPELTIERIPYPKWWRDSLNATINLQAPGTATLATVTARLRLFVATIVITVTGETQVTIHFGNAGDSGPISLGGEGQPMGFVAAMGNSPAPCGNGNLTITATDPNGENPSVTGWATCFVERN